MHPVPGAAVRFADVWAAASPPCLLAVVLCLAQLSPTSHHLAVRTHKHNSATALWSRAEERPCDETNFQELPRIKKLSSFESSEPDWSWVLNLTKVEAAARGHKSDWQASLLRGALWYLRWWLDRQIIIPPIRVPFSALWSLQRVMACSCRSASGCLRSHYPTGSSAVINDKRPEYWFVNLQSGAIRCSLQKW